MFSIDVNASTVSHEAGRKKPEDSPVGVYYIAEKDDVKALTGPEVVSVFNAVVRAMPEMKWREVNRFSTREVGDNRLWGMFVCLKANIDAGTVEEVPPKPEPAKKEAKAKTAKAPKKKREPKADGARTSRISDKELKPASKIYPVREGSMQEKCLNLISQRGGISVDDFVVEMNKGPGKPKWERGNVWSSLRYILHAKHGYGISVKDEQLRLINKD